MKKSLIALALALSVAAPLAANASESNGIGYNNVQLDYIYEDAGSFNGNGLGLSGSYAFTDHFFVTGSYARTQDGYGYATAFPDYATAFPEYVPTVGYAANEVHQISGDLKHDSWTLGVGFNTAIGNRADWVSQLAYARHETSDDYTSCRLDNYYCVNADSKDHINGFNLSTGVRGRITDQLTANAYLGYEDYENQYDGNFYADLDVGYNFTPTWSVETGVKLAESTETWNLGVRASF